MSDAGYRNSNPLKGIPPRRTASQNPNLVNPLETAYEGAKDALNIIRDEQKRRGRQLQDYTGEDEDTKRTDVHVHVHQHSQPDIESESPQLEVGPVKVRGLPKWATAAVVGIGLVAAAATAIASWFAARSGGH